MGIEEARVVAEAALRICSTSAASSSLLRERRDYRAAQRRRLSGR
jgi:hypothetical protein